MATFGLKMKMCPCALASDLKSALAYFLGWVTLEMSAFFCSWTKDSWVEAFCPFPSISAFNLILFALSGTSLSFHSLWTSFLDISSALMIMSSHLFGYEGRVSQWFGFWTWNNWLWLYLLLAPFYIVYVFHRGFGLDICYFTFHCANLGRSWADSTWHFWYQTLLTALTWTRNLKKRRIGPSARNSTSADRTAAANSHFDYYVDKSVLPYLQTQKNTSEVETTTNNRMELLENTLSFVGGLFFL